MIRIAGTSAAEQAAVCLQIPQRMTIGYPQKVVHQFSSELQLSSNPGSLWLVRGSNGTGKTTLFKTLAGCIPPLNSTHRFSPNRPNIYFLPDTLTLPEHVDPRELMQRGGNAKFALDAADSLLIPKKKKFGELSWGNRRKAALCISLSRIPAPQTPQLILWDEPFTGLDDVSMDYLHTTLRMLAHPHRLILLSAHGFRSLDQLAAGTLNLSANAENHHAYIIRHSSSSSAQLIS